ncbi:interleukin-27 subunit beta [Rhineura floridana]|uniref:interleukin-27 subunit beta n=1 Tax=Rhineura floridana TaxID=261503 RepID=UPI002AC826A5|nr:interleukin-27 subunit beta [Rhineura floridana]XP_061457140.1 interleukin-27 subunit beta [Rhineura floridana]
MRRIVLMLAFVLSPCFTSCEGASWRSKEAAGLIHQQYASHGASEVLLRCPVPEGSSTVEWKVNGTSRGILAAARDEGSLALQNASLLQEGEYSCYELLTGKLLRRIQLKLGYPPGKPSVWCRSTTYAAINCTWRLKTKTHLVTSFFSTYRLGLSGEVQECIQPTTGASSCSIDNVQMFPVNPYILNITASNPLGTVTSLFSFFQNEILKPDPPEDVKVSPIPGERKKLLLEWKPPSSWQFPEYFPLKYLIRYSRDGTDSSKTTRPLEQTSFVWTGVRPGVTYHVQVAAKDFLDNGKYSDWSSKASGAAWMPE